MAICELQPEKWTLKKSPLFGFFVFFYKRPVIIKTNEKNGECEMSKRLFSAFEQKQLESNPNVNHVSDRSISYAADFKVRAVQENLSGKGPMAIFLDHGFDLKLIGSDKPGECLKRWRSVYKAFGEEGFYTERRGKGSTGRPSSKTLSAEEQLKKAEARIAFLEMENDFLKKLEELERQAKKKD